MATPEPYATMLNLIKVDLGIVNATGYDVRLLSLLQSCEKEIKFEGVILDLSDRDDQDLVIDLARWTWLNRREAGDGATMSRSIRWRINKRLFSQKRVSQNPEE
ncbi:MAG: hypothetical protein IKY16_02450 [Bacteroidales bacterium]|nr:hypothetical protein [Bacteroidales bacterium]